MPTLPQNLERIMKARGLRPRTLSLKAGLNATAVRDIIAGRSRRPLYSTLEKLAWALECRISDLVEDAHELAEAQSADAHRIVTQWDPAAWRSDTNRFFNDYTAALHIGSVYGPARAVQILSDRDLAEHAGSHIRVMSLSDAGKNRFTLGPPIFLIPSLGFETPPDKLMALQVLAGDMMPVFTVGDLVIVDLSKLPPNYSDVVLFRADQPEGGEVLVRRLDEVVFGGWQVRTFTPTLTDILPSAEWRPSPIVARIIKPG
jgi:DNA-binding Xre family transcriptional regulator